MKRYLLLCCPLFLSGCRSRDVDVLVQVGQRTAQKLEAGFGLSPEVLAGRLRGPVAEASLAGRVRVRLLYDRPLQGIPVEVATPSSGVVRLRATVPDAAVRQRILDLTRATTGVEQVIDEMSLVGQ